MTQRSSGPTLARPNSWAGRLILGLLAVGLSAVAGLILMTPGIPLGVVGEWVWNRTGQPPIDPVLWTVPLMAAGLYLAFAWVGGWILERGSEVWILLLVPMLVVLAYAWQFAAVTFVPIGPERYVPSVYFESTSGYYRQAASIEDMDAFLASYEAWLEGADSFHQGTHPPGLIWCWWQLRKIVARQPALGSWIENAAPARVLAGFELLPAPLPATDRQAIIAGIMLTWAASLLTLVPIYGLTRLTTTPAIAWWSATLWPVIPASLVFVPTADAVYPLLSVLAMWLILLGHQSRFAILCLLGGATIALGMMLSLAFVVVLAIAGGTLALLMLRDGGWWRGIVSVVAMAAGVALPVEFLVTSADINMLSIWSINLEKHAGFYDAMPRSWWPWLVINPLEFAVMTTPAVSILAFVFASRRGLARDGGTLARMALVVVVVLAALDGSGRNRSEVARLWLFLTPLVLAAAAGWLGTCRNRLEVDFWCVGLLALAAVITLISIGWVEPLLPIAVTP